MPDGDAEVTDRLCHERMKQMEQEMALIEKNLSSRMQVTEIQLKGEIKNACEINKLELRALKNYIIGMGVGISIVIVLVNLLLWGVP